MHKIHVRTDKLIGLYTNKFINKLAVLGHVDVSHTENYTNFYVYVPNTLDRETVQTIVNNAFTALGYKIYT